ncbi:hypothetical protein ACFQ44_05745 [Levilactobacillus lanxiensis]|uniref:Uncharacterized protein n=1 Tax=Levilactobacillus lanxiensis TaxID=2799568 RepID=A0ABW4D5M0_9LACO|nr:hypothetical protein [Levilactobacillus lanxiensis]
MSDNDSIQITDINDIITALPNVDENATFWMIRTNQGDYYTDFITGQYVGIGYDEISLKETQEKTNDQLSALFHDSKPEDKDHRKIPDATYTTWVGQLKRFGNEIKAGDYVLIPGTSSNRFSLGVVLGLPYELSAKELEEINSEKIEGRTRSPYKKRLKVQFLKSFNRSEADPALYKMIYTQTTVSKIDKYAPYILRAVFDAYISGNKMYLTFPVTEKKDIKALPYTSFTYHLAESYAAIDENSEAIIKSNVQSAGIVQLILTVSVAAGMFGLAWVLFKSKTGFQIDVNLLKGKFKLKKEDERIVVQRIKDAQSARDLKEQSAQLDMDIKKQEANDAHLKRMAKMAEIISDSGDSMEKIKAEVPSELREAIKKATLPTDHDDQEE